MLKESKNEKIKETMKEVYEALEEKGYNPINQIVGYILSGDPTYITSHNNARNTNKTSWKRWITRKYSKGLFRIWINRWDY